MSRSCQALIVASPAMLRDSYMSFSSIAVSWSACECSRPLCSTARASGSTTTPLQARKKIYVAGNDRGTSGGVSQIHCFNWRSECPFKRMMVEANWSFRAATQDSLSIMARAKMDIQSSRASSRRDCDDHLLQTLTTS